MKRNRLLLAVSALFTLFVMFSFTACNTDTPEPAVDVQVTQGDGQGAVDPVPGTPDTNGGEAGGEEPGDVIDLDAVAGDPEVPPSELEGDLNIWSFTNEALVLATAFQGLHPNLNIDFRMASMDDDSYQQMVAQAIAAGGTDVPDVIFLEVGFVRSFVEEEGWLRDLSHFLPNAREVETIPFTIQAGTDDAGITRAFSYQAAAGAMFYRRSMAERYFGVSEPEDVAPLFTNLEDFMDAARSIREQSGGSTRIVSSPTEVFRAFLPNRSQPWIVNNMLTVDPLMLEYMTFAYAMRDEGLDAQVGQWTEHWFSAMSDNLVDAAGNSIEVFSFFMPTWGLPFIIMPNAEETFGDWGIITGPLPYQWGGSWIGVTEVANNVEAAEEFVRWATLDEQQLRDWALGTYTEEFLAAIDPNVPSDLSQPAGDLVSSSRLIRELAPYLYGTPSSDFIGGQNPYTAFGEAALQVSFELMQGTDAMIGDHFIDAVDLYITGEATREEALESFRNVVRMELPNLSW